MLNFKTILLAGNICLLFSTANLVFSQSNDQIHRTGEKLLELELELNQSKHQIRRNHRTLHAAKNLVDQVDQLREYLGSGGDANLPVGGTSLLTLACHAGNLESMELLLSHGASIDRTTATEDPVLLTAFVKTPSDCLRLVLAKGADPNVISKRTGQSVLHLVATGDYVTRIFGLKANDPQGLSEAERNAIKSYSEQEAFLLETMVKCGGDLTLKNHEGMTPLEVAKKHGITRLFRSLTPDTLPSDGKSDIVRRRTLNQEWHRRFGGARKGARDR